MLNLNSNIQYIKGVGEKRAGLFNSLGIFDIDSLVHFYPRKYEDWSVVKSLKDVQNGDTVCVKCMMITPVKKAEIRRGLTLFKCRFSDGETVVAVTIFNNRFLAESLKVYEEYLLYGKVDKTFTSVSMSSPKIEKANSLLKIHPIYPAKEKLTSQTIMKIMKTALDEIGEIPETLSEEIREKYSLISLDTAIRNIHFPKSSQEISQARNRLIFEELLVLSLGLLKLKGNKKKETSIKINTDFSSEFETLIPFNLTTAQKNAIKDCVNDMMGNHPMNRLVQGDVGCGKTAVAASIIYTVIKNGYQAAMMAPTEILANQHYESLKNILDKAGVKAGLLTGSMTAKEKREIKKQIENGEIDLVVGTHAIIQDDVVFKNIALVITDEQHRFGVKQREKLAKKGDSLHTVVMSATPIPRTLGLILYGDLDISIIDELPPGRQVIRTDVVDSRYNKRLYKFIRDAIDRGEQCYIVCPAVEENENDLKSAEEFAENLANNDFKGYNLGILHGKMKAKDKDSIMKAFADNDVQILVSTTVVEVGVDVPNATIMVVENAERFGLSTLHQLRGRVGRGDKKSYCVLVSDSDSDNAKTRLMAMKQYSDGFKIADIDLKQRGPGDFFGNRQHGLPQLKIADMAEDVDVLSNAMQCSKDILKTDFNLKLPENQPLASRINKMFENLNI